MDTTPQTNRTALETWLRRDLARRFNDATEEPLPSDWLDLLGTVPET